MLSRQLEHALDFLRLRKQSYQQLKLSFGSAALRDLATFCRANETCVVRKSDGSVDDRLSYVLEGRREVWLRIQQHFNLTPNQLLNLYSGSDLEEIEND